MKLRTWAVGLAAIGALALSSSVVLSQDKKGDANGKGGPGQMSPEEKAKAEAMAEAWEKMSALGENHKLLAEMVGDWDYENKFTMEPGAPEQTEKGTSSVKPLWEGRYFTNWHKGQFMGQPFEGVVTVGYDNMKKKFVSTWIDNMGTGIMVFEGAYDAPTKTFTYTSEMDDPMNPGKKVKIREVIKIIDKDKHVMEWYEGNDGKEHKGMQITYTRKK